MTVKKVLIVYDSGFGTTAEIAKLMAEQLRAQHFTVESQPADKARAPDEDEAVIIGSAIRYDRWLPDARAYLDRHQEVLAKAPVAYFYSCLTLAANTTSTESEQVYDAKLLALNPSVKPMMVGGFAGALRYGAMPWYFRLIFGLIARSKGLKGGDYRDWAAIKSWINQLAKKL